MTPKPHDAVDPRLAPLAMQLDERIAALGGLPADMLRDRVEPDGDRPARTRAEREERLLASITRSLDLAGWTVSWDPRGVRLAHGSHCLVLGVAQGLRDFVTLGRLAHHDGER